MSKLNISIITSNGRVEKQSINNYNNKYIFMLCYYIMFNEESEKNKIIISLVDWWLRVKDNRSDEEQLYYITRLYTNPKPIFHGYEFDIFRSYTVTFVAINADDKSIISIFDCGAPNNEQEVKRIIQDNLNKELQKNLNNLTNNQW